jgi:glycerophosphoryl diester phosphodiesterase
VGSFLAAVACGLSWVELDVHRSRDGELMVTHDPVTPSGDVIVTRTTAELAAVGVASLADVLAALPADIAVNIDVKTIIDDSVDPLAQRTYALVGRGQSRAARCLPAHRHAEPAPRPDRADVPEPRADHPDRAPGRP